MKHTPALVEQAVLQARAAGIPASQVATELGVHTTTVQAIVRRHGDLGEALKEVRSDYFTSGFKYVWLQALDRVRGGVGLSSQDVKNYALAMAISIDKVALIQGWPTQVVAHLHEHRHEVSDIAGKLAEVARRVGAGPAPEVTPEVDLA